MRQSIRIATLTLAGAFALAAFAGPATALTGPGHGHGGTGISAVNGNSILNGNLNNNRIPVCVSGVDAVNVKVPIASSRPEGCVQSTR